METRHTETQYIFALTAGSRDSMFLENLAFSDGAGNWNSLCPERVITSKINGMLTKRLQDRNACGHTVNRYEASRTEFREVLGNFLETPALQIS